MEQERIELLSRRLRRDEGTALVVVLLAIVILLPPTLILATLALRWQRQSIDLRDMLTEELLAESAFEEARARLAGTELDIPLREGRSFSPSFAKAEGEGLEARISHPKDVVLTLDGRVLEGSAAERADLELTGTDPEGRVVYRFRKVEIYLVEVSVSRRETLAPVRLHGIVARLPDGGLQTLGVTRTRVY